MSIHNSICVVVHNILSTIFPKAILDHIIIPYIIEQYKYKYSKYTSELYDNVHYNQQLNILFCASVHSYKLIDFSTGLASSLIDKKPLFATYNDNPCSINNVIYFNDNILIMCDYNQILIKYIFHDGIWKRSGHNYIRQLVHSTWINSYSTYTYNNNIYVYAADNNTSIIIVHDMYELNRIQYSQEYIYYDDITYHNISVHDNTIYIYEQATSTTHIHAHDIKTLNRTSSREFTHGSTNTQILLHKDKIYKCENNIVYVYDLTTFELIHTFNVTNARAEMTNNYIKNISMSNDVMMLSNDREIIIYSLM
jgi:hypothetical protein